MRGYYCKQKGCQKWDSAMAALSHFLAYRTLLTRMMISAIYAALTAARRPHAIMHDARRPRRCRSRSAPMTNPATARTNITAAPQKGIPSPLQRVQQVREHTELVREAPGQTLGAALSGVKQQIVRLDGRKHAAVGLDAEIDAAHFQQLIHDPGGTAETARRRDFRTGH